MATHSDVVVYAWFAFFLALFQPVSAGYSVTSIWYFWFGMFFFILLLAFLFGACKRHHAQRNRLGILNARTTFVATTATSSVNPYPAAAAGGVTVYPTTVINPNYQQPKPGDPSLPQPPPYHPQAPPYHPQAPPYHPQAPPYPANQQQPPPYGFVATPVSYNDSAYPPPPPPTYATATAPQQQQASENPFQKAARSQS